MSGVLDWPTLRIFAEGELLPRVQTAMLGYAVLRQALGVPAAAELDFAEPDSRLIDRMGIGSALRLHIGQVSVFEGRISQVEFAYDNAGGQVLRVRAYDALHNARLRRVPTRRQDCSAATLGAEVAGRSGASFSCDGSPTVHPLLFQTSQSDFELLVTLSGEDGLYPLLSGGELALLTLEGRGTELPLRLGRNLHSVAVSASDEHAIRRAQTRAWRSDTLETFNETVGLARQDALEMHDVRLSSAEDSAIHLFLDRIVSGRQQAQAIAQAAMDRAAAAEALVEGVAEGNPDIAPGRPIKLQGAAQQYCGRYVVTQVVHRLDTATGYTTEFSSSPPRLRERDRTPVITYARVCDIDDPEEVGRCRVKLEQFGGLETGWLQSVVSGAGRGRGLASLAELQDAVLIVLPDGDPANGFVLGGLYGSERLPLGLNVRQKRPYVLRTGGGQALELGRDTPLARLSTANGNVVELTPEQVRIAAVSDLLIEAPGKTITIRANAIAFEQG